MPRTPYLISLDRVDGNGPCNQERIDNRRRAHEDGEWVREAALAHAAKKAAMV